MADPREIFRGASFPWPFPDDRFPDQLGVVVMRTVADGAAPALDVFHFPGKDWAVADGYGDPNEDGACTVVHMADLTQDDPSLLELVTMPPGKMASREKVGAPWVISDFED